MKPARILVVEDDRVVARHLEQQLIRMGYLVCGKTATGEEACELALRLAPDLILMDIRLEGPLDGIDAAARINRGACIPVVFLTAYADAETVRRARLTDPFGYLLKPFEDVQLGTVIEMALYKHASERRLRESERRFAATLASIGDAVIATNARREVSYLNPIAERLTGWYADRAIGRPLREVFAAIDEDTRGAVDVIAGPMLLVHVDGSERPIDASDSPIIDDRGISSGAVIAFRDLTRQRDAAEALRNTQQDLERWSQASTISELAASIAHEINQPLAAIATNAGAGLNWLGRDAPDIAEARGVLEQIQDDAMRAAQVIRSLQALARRASPELAAVDLHALIEEVSTLMRDDLRRHSIQLSTCLDAERPCAFLDRTQIRQVLVNLVQNAIEATADNGGRPRCLSLSTRSVGDGVQVRVVDNGSGLAEADRLRVFEPFYSTKRDGMGMGLAICRSIVEAHGGALWSTPGERGGTAFVFDLPPSGVDSGAPPGGSSMSWPR